jgi:hypothetical protein
LQKAAWLLQQDSWLSGFCKRWDNNLQETIGSAALFMLPALVRQRCSCVRWQEVHGLSSQCWRKFGDSYKLQTHLAAFVCSAAHCLSIFFVLRKHLVVD